MKLLTQDLLGKFRSTGSQENIPDPIVIAKFFAPWSNWTWYATEYDEIEELFFGYVVGIESEWGYFSLRELEFVRGHFGLTIERDMHFGYQPLSEVLSRA